MSEKEKVQIQRFNTQWSMTRIKQILGPIKQRSTADLKCLAILEAYFKLAPTLQAEGIGCRGDCARFS